MSNIRKKRFNFCHLPDHAVDKWEEKKIDELCWYSAPWRRSELPPDSRDQEAPAPPYSPGSEGGDVWNMKKCRNIVKMMIL